MKIKNLAFFGIMAAILGVNGAARADSTTIIASQAYVDAKDALKQNNLGGTVGGQSTAGKVVEATATAGTVNYRGIDTTPTASSSNLITSGGVQAAIAAVDLSSAVSQTITEDVTDKAPSEDAVFKAINVAENGNYIQAGTGVGDNLKALDDQVKTNTSDIDTNATNIGTNTTNIGTINTNIGTIGNLDTTATNLVGAINEVNTAAGAAQDAADAAQATADAAVVANNAITGATHTKITYDSKGLVTGGSDITLSDVTDVTATAAEVNKLAGLATTATELGYVNGVTSAIQTQLDNKQANLGGTGNGNKAVIASETEGSVTYKDITTASANIASGSANLVTAGAVADYVSSANSAVSAAYDANALDREGLAAHDNLAKMEAIQDTVARQGTLDKAWHEEFDANAATTANATNLHAASKNSNNGADMDNYVPTVKAVETRINKERNSINTALGDKVDKNAAITGATKTKITYDSKGLVTAGADLEESDIPDLHLAKVTDVTASAAEVNILDGATVTTTELNYVSGVTSGIQSQLDDKVAKNTNITASSANSIVQYDAKGLVTSGTAAGALATKDKVGNSDVTANSLEYKDTMNYALSNVDTTGGDAHDRCTAKSPCTLTMIWSNDKPVYEWTSMDTEDTAALL